MAKLLLIRFSALGDVAMTVPVLCSLAKAYPDLEISILTRKEFAPLFLHLPENVHFIGASLRDEHKGWLGLHRLYYKLLAPERFDYVADCHSVLRSWVLDCRFLLAGKKVARIRKGRAEKKRLTRARQKCLVPLKTSIERYAETLARLGFRLPESLPFASIFGDKKGSLGDLPCLIPSKKDGEYWIGVAPFARHRGKTYPLEAMQEVVLHLAERGDTKVFLFGAGKEKTKLLEWSMEYPDRIILPAGSINLEGELVLMSHLDLMISMDSANMHFASLVGTRTLSIWGATHPYGGFLGYGQRLEDCVQVEKPCRPCSVFGNKACRYGSYPCLEEISVDMIVQRVEQIIGKRHD